jgi:hypothetical protein
LRYNSNESQVEFSNDGITYEPIGVADQNGIFDSLATLTATIDTPNNWTGCSPIILCSSSVVTSIDARGIIKPTDGYVAVIERKAAISYAGDTFHFVGNGVEYQIDGYNIFDVDDRVSNMDFMLDPFSGEVTVQVKCDGTGNAKVKVGIITF